MSWRGIYFSEAARLSLKQGQIFIRREGHEDYSLPVEDIAYIVLDSLAITLSAALLSACAEQSCLILVSDKKHMPCGALLPFNQYYRQAETVQQQLSLTLPRQKQLWQTIIKHKIANQSACLTCIGSEKQAQRLVALAQKVRSGDPNNIEAHAARIYWSAFEKNFVRDTSGNDRLNGMLNYGYALLRSAIARELAALGFITSLGVFHRSMTNAFNLADDMVEPWRPFVDYLVKSICDKSPCTDFSKEDRQLLCSIFTTSVEFETNELQLLSAVRRYVTMIKTWMLESKSTIAFPKFIYHPQRDKPCPQKK